MSRNPSNNCVRAADVPSNENPVSLVFDVEGRSRVEAEGMTSRGNGEFG